MVDKQDCVLHTLREKDFVSWSLKHHQQSAWLVFNFWSDAGLASDQVAVQTDVNVRWIVWNCKLINNVEAKGVTEAALNAIYKLSLRCTVKTKVHQLCEAKYQFILEYIYFFMLIIPSFGLVRNKNRCETNTCCYLFFCSSDVQIFFCHSKGCWFIHVTILHALLLLSYY